MKDLQSTLLNQTTKPLSTLNIWKLPIFFNIFNRSQALQFLMGASSENTNTKWLNVIYFSKNNVDIFNWHFLRMRCFLFYATFRWINTSFLSAFSNRTIKVMFASRTPVFANLMSWASLVTDSIDSSNRWLNGRLSAQIKIRIIPNYLLIPDPEENSMITREAFRKKIPIISITNSDSTFNGAIVLLGNNRSFRYVSQLTEMVIRFLQLGILQTNAISHYTEPLVASSWFYRRKFTQKMDGIGGISI